MKIKITQTNDSVKQEILVNDIKNFEDFTYVDTFDSLNDIHIEEGFVKIFRKDKEHNTLVYLSNYENSFIEIFTVEGSLHFDIKIIEFIQNQSIITIAYVLQDTVCKLKIQMIQEN